MVECGSAYIFVRDGTSWSQQAKLTASDGAAEDRFGWSVAIYENHAFVGAYGDYSGSAYILLEAELVGLNKKNYWLVIIKVVIFLHGVLQ